MTAEELAALPIPDTLRFNIRVVDLNGAVLAEGRDLARAEAQRSTRRGRAVEVAAADSRASPLGLRRSAVEQRVVQRRGLRFTVYPTLRDRRRRGRAGGGGERGTMQRSRCAPAVLRLAMLALPEQFKYARKRFADDRDIVLLGQGMNTARPMAESLAERAFSECFLGEDAPLPRTAEQFEALLDRHRSGFGEVVDRVLAHARETLRELRNVRQKLAALDSPAFKHVQQDARAQLQGARAGGFPDRRARRAVAALAALSQGARRVGSTRRPAIRSAMRS